MKFAEGDIGRRRGRDGEEGKKEGDTCALYKKHVEIKRKKVCRGRRRKKSRRWKEGKRDSDTCESLKKENMKRRSRGDGDEYEETGIGRKLWVSPYSNHCEGNGRPGGASITSCGTVRAEGARWEGHYLGDHLFLPAPRPRNTCQPFTCVCVGGRGWQRPGPSPHRAVPH